MIKVKDLKEAIKELKDDKEVVISSSYRSDEEIEIEYIEELKENGRKYYRVSIYNGIG
ncbi:hypothetical protein H3301_gp014 [IAS virus]|jgi:hypothetical protein|uniref:hypothetical protein n=1 Tax=IAS virus TaxID=1450749 RepID=UPI00191F48DB|nr:hypothetical protein H3301_gp014 [IAS virus]